MDETIFKLQFYLDRVYTKSQLDLHAYGETDKVVIQKFITVYEKYRASLKLKERHLKIEDVKDITLSCYLNKVVFLAIYTALKKTGSPFDSSLADNLLQYRLLTQEQLEETQPEKC